MSRIEPQTREVPFPLAPGQVGSHPRVPDPCWRGIVQGSQSEPSSTFQAGQPERRSEFSSTGSSPGWKFDSMKKQLAFSSRDCEGVIAGKIPADTEASSPTPSIEKHTPELRGRRSRHTRSYPGSELTARFSALATWVSSPSALRDALRDQGVWDAKQILTASCSFVSRRRLAHGNARPRYLGWLGSDKASSH